MTATKCVIILSEKSSGSSACQKILAKFGVIKHVANTRHHQNETLYWTKAASILELPQLDMIDSEVPIAAPQARAQLIDVLRKNIPDYELPENDRELIFDGWKQLCRQFQPIFLEKSPHHLCQWSALELMHECMQEARDIEFLFIGLIRNPMDTLYSQFQRWRTRPEALQDQWLTAYRNLQRFKQLTGVRLVILRYEDMVTSLQHLQPVFDFCEVEAAEADRNFLHPKSLLKWRDDASFGFELSDEVVALAKLYGYREEELRNRKYMLWPLYREARRAGYKIKRLVRQFLRLATAKRVVFLFKHCLVQVTHR